VNHGLPLPDFQIKAPNLDVPPPVRRFVGVWISEKEIGRKLMLIVTGVDNGGQAGGYWAYGPPTPTSFPPGPPGFLR
jgi:hypothetical protein